MAKAEPWGQESTTVGYCAFCPKWKIEGPHSDVVARAREHRLTVHPDLHPPKRRRRPSLSTWRTTINKEESVEMEQERSRRLRLLGIEPQV